MNIKAKLLINEFGNGFVNYEDKTIYINKKDLSNAFNLEEVSIEYYCKNNLYYGKVINYSLIDKVFIGIVHHIYQDEIYIYCDELKKNLIAIKITDVVLNKNTWVSVKITADKPKLIGKFIGILENNIDDIIEKKFKLDLIEFPQIYGTKKSNHIDQTDLDTFTIDPLESQDCDDAFSIKECDDGIHIYVHISDVAYYINPDLKEFDTVMERGNTYYGTNKNWPMIPRNYSDNICSILPNKKTYVVTCEFIYNKGFPDKILYCGYYYSEIISKNKYCYEHVDMKLDDMKLDDMKLKIIYETSKIIKASIPDFIINKESKAHSMIKYWMIKINQVMASEIQKIYRCNSKPEANKFNIVKEYIGTYTNIEDRTELLNYLSKETSKTKLLDYLIKQLLTKAYYDNSDKNYHYGLGIDNYTHWTSPIRRSCDLLNHCILRGYNIDNNIRKYLINMNETELKQNAIENFIINQKNKFQINQMVCGIIIGLGTYGITVYIEDFDNKYTIHISKLSEQKLHFENNILYNECDKYELFDYVNLIIVKIDFDQIDLEKLKN